MGTDTVRGARPTHLRGQAAPSQDLNLFGYRDSRGLNLFEFKPIRNGNIGLQAMNFPFHSPQ